MTVERQKKIEEEYRFLYNCIWNCVRADNKSERIRLGLLLSKYFHNSRQSNYKMYDMFDDLINKLTTAAQTIQDQNDWLDCIYTALGDDPNKIIYTATVAQKVLNKKKKRLKKEE